MPFTVADTPFRVSGSGKRGATAGPAAKPEPNTLASIPGAKLDLNDAPFVIPSTLIELDEPTTKVTGMVSAGGFAFGAWTVTIAEYAPGDNPAADASSRKGPVPLPNAGVSFNHVARAGAMVAVHASEPVPRSKV